eukprot:scaffold33689_cov184-Skeletonema_dohrnii-CCMP3373.AAC.1
MQESSSFQEWWNEMEESSSAFASILDRYKDEEAASSINEESGENPSQDHPQGGGDTIMRNNPYLPHRFQYFSPSHAQLPGAFHPPQKQKQHEHLDDNLFPLPVAVAHPHSPVRRNFGNEFYISPERPAPAAHLDLKKDHPLSTATVATETEVTLQTYAVKKHEGLKNNLKRKFIDLSDVPPQPPIPKRRGHIKDGASKFTG